MAKQPGILVFSVPLIILPLKHITIPPSSLATARLGRELAYIAAGAATTVVPILLLLVAVGSFTSFVQAMLSAVSEVDAWNKIPAGYWWSGYMKPFLMSNPIVTLALGLLGANFVLHLFLFRPRESFGLKAIAVWILIYGAVIIFFTSGYLNYYLPLVAPLSIVAGYVLASVLKVVLGAGLQASRVALLILVLLLLLTPDIYGVKSRFQFLEDPVKTTTLDTPPQNELVPISAYLFEHTSPEERIFAINPTYALQAGRLVVNHTTASPPGLPTREELIDSIERDNVKYVVVDERARWHFPRKWSGEPINNMSISFDLNVIDPETEPADGVVVQITNSEKGRKTKRLLWWLRTGDWEIPNSREDFVHLDLPVEAGQWVGVVINVSDTFRRYFGYEPLKLDVVIGANANAGSSVRFLLDDLRIQANDYNLYEDFSSMSSLARFTQTVVGEVRGSHRAVIDAGRLDMKASGETFHLNLPVSTGVMGYIKLHYASEREYLIHKHASEELTTKVTLYVRRDQSKQKPVFNELISEVVEIK